MRGALLIALRRRLVISGTIIIGVCGFIIARVVIGGRISIGWIPVGIRVVRIPGIVRPAVVPEPDAESYSPAAVVVRITIVIVSTIIISAASIIGTAMADIRAPIGTAGNIAPVGADVATGTAAVSRSTGISC